MRLRAGPIVVVTLVASGCTNKLIAPGIATFEDTVYWSCVGGGVAPNSGSAATTSAPKPANNAKERNRNRRCMVQILHQRRMTRSDMFDAESRFGQMMAAS